MKNKVELPPKNVKNNFKQNSTPAGLTMTFQTCMYAFSFAKLVSHAGVGWMIQAQPGTAALIQGGMIQGGMTLLIQALTQAGMTAFIQLFKIRRKLFSTIDQIVRASEEPDRSASKTRRRKMNGQPLHT